MEYTFSMTIWKRRLRLFCLNVYINKRRAARFAFLATEIKYSKIPPICSCSGGVVVTFSDVATEAFTATAVCLLWRWWSEPVLHLPPTLFSPALFKHLTVEDQEEEEEEEGGKFKGLEDRNNLVVDMVNWLLILVLVVIVERGSVFLYSKEDS